jgi:hypothetical protein
MLMRHSFNSRDFLAHFGVSAYICSVAWGLMREGGLLTHGEQCCHLLWALCWLKVYATDTVMLSILNLNSIKTYTKWRDMVLDDLYNLDLVRRRWLHWSHTADTQNICFYHHCLLTTSSQHMYSYSLWYFVWAADRPITSVWRVEWELMSHVNWRNQLCHIRTWAFWSKVVFGEAQWPWIAIWNWDLHTNRLHCLDQWAFSLWSMTQPKDFIWVPVTLVGSLGILSCG